MTKTSKCAREELAAFCLQGMGLAMGRFDEYRERSLLVVALVQYLASRSIRVELPRSTRTNERASASPVKD